MAAVQDDPGANRAADHPASIVPNLAYPMHGRQSSLVETGGMHGVLDQRNTKNRGQRPCWADFRTTLCTDNTLSEERPRRGDIDWNSADRPITEQFTVLYWKEGSSTYTAATVIDMTAPSGQNTFPPIDIDLAPQDKPYAYPVYSAEEKCFIGLVIMCGFQSKEHYARDDFEGIGPHACALLVGLRDARPGQPLSVTRMDVGLAADLGTTAREVIHDKYSDSHLLLYTPKSMKFRVVELDFTTKDPSYRKLPPADKQFTVYTTGISIFDADGSFAASVSASTRFRHVAFATKPARGRRQFHIYHRSGDAYERCKVVVPPTDGGPENETQDWLEFDESNKWGTALMLMNWSRPSYYTWSGMAEQLGFMGISQEPLHHPVIPSSITQSGIQYFILSSLHTETVTVFTVSNGVLRHHLTITNFVGTARDWIDDEKWLSTRRATSNYRAFVTPDNLTLVVAYGGAAMLYRLDAIPSTRDPRGRWRYCSGAASILTHCVSSSSKCNDDEFLVRYQDEEYWLCCNECVVTGALFDKANGRTNELHPGSLGSVLITFDFATKYDLSPYSTSLDFWTHNPSFFATVDKDAGTIRLFRLKKVRTQSRDTLDSWMLEDGSSFACARATVLRFSPSQTGAMRLIAMFMPRDNHDGYSRVGIFDCTEDIKPLAVTSAPSLTCAVFPRFDGIRDAADELIVACRGLVNRKVGPGKFWLFAISLSTGEIENYLRYSHFDNTDTYFTYPTVLAANRSRVGRELKMFAMSRSRKELVSLQVIGKHWDNCFKELADDAGAGPWSPTEGRVVPTSKVEQVSYERRTGRHIWDPQSATQISRVMEAAKFVMHRTKFGDDTVRWSVNLMAKPFNKHPEVSVTFVCKESGYFPRVDSSADSVKMTSGLCGAAPTSAIEVQPGPNQSPGALIVFELETFTVEPQACWIAEGPLHTLSDGEEAKFHVGSSKNGRFYCSFVSRLPEKTTALNALEIYDLDECRSQKSLNDGSSSIAVGRAELCVKGREDSPMNFYRLAPLLFFDPSKLRNAPDSRVSISSLAPYGVAHVEFSACGTFVAVRMRTIEISTEAIPSDKRERHTLIAVLDLHERTVIRTYTIGDIWRLLAFDTDLSTIDFDYMSEWIRMGPVNGVQFAVYGANQIADKYGGFIILQHRYEAVDPRAVQFRFRNCDWAGLKCFPEHVHRRLAVTTRWNRPTIPVTARADYSPRIDVLLQVNLTAGLGAAVAYPGLTFFYLRLFASPEDPRTALVGSTIPVFTSETMHYNLIDNTVCYSIGGQTLVLINTSKQLAVFEVLNDKSKIEEFLTSPDAPLSVPTVRSDGLLLSTRALGEFAPVTRAALREDGLRLCISDKGWNPADRINANKYSIRVFGRRCLAEPFVELYAAIQNGPLIQNIALADGTPPRLQWSKPEDGILLTSTRGQSWNDVMMWRMEEPDGGGQNESSNVFDGQIKPWRLGAVYHRHAAAHTSFRVEFLEQSPLIVAVSPTDTRTRLNMRCTNNRVMQLMDSTVVRSFGSPIITRRCLRSFIELDKHLANGFRFTQALFREHPELLQFSARALPESMTAADEADSDDCSVTPDVVNLFKRRDRDGLLNSLLTIDRPDPETLATLLRVISSHTEIPFEIRGVRDTLLADVVSRGTLCGLLLDHIAQAHREANKDARGQPLITAPLARLRIDSVGFARNLCDIADRRPLQVADFLKDYGLTLFGEVGSRTSEQQRLMRNAPRAVDVSEFTRRDGGSVGVVTTWSNHFIIPPQGLWGTLGKENDHTTHGDSQPQGVRFLKPGNVPVEAMFISIPFAAKFTMCHEDSGPIFQRMRNSFFHRITDNAWLRDTAELFDNDIMRALVDFKWDSHGKHLFRHECLLYVLNLALMSAFTLLVVADGRPDPPPRISAIVIAALISVLCVRSMVIELYQMRVYRRVYVDTWNAIDIAVVTATATAIGLFFAGTDDAATNRLCGIACLATWIQGYHFLQGFRKTGPLVKMCLRIFLDVRFFMLLLAMMVIGSTFLYWGVTSGEGFGGKADFSATFFVVYQMLLLGEYDPSDFDEAANSITAKIAFVILSMAVLIILLNLLIALLSDSFEEIKERESMEFTMQRANLICHLEVLHMTGREVGAYPDVVHVLQPSGGQARYLRQSWRGIAGQIRKDLYLSEKRILSELAERDERQRRLHEEGLHREAGKEAIEKSQNHGPRMADRTNEVSELRDLVTTELAALRRRISNLADALPATA